MASHTCVTIQKLVALLKPATDDLKKILLPAGLEDFGKNSLYWRAFSMIVKLLGFDVVPDLRRYNESIALVSFDCTSTTQR